MVARNRSCPEYPADKRIGASVHHLVAMPWLLARRFSQMPPLQQRTHQPTSMSVPKSISQCASPECSSLCSSVDRYPVCLMQRGRIVPSLIGGSVVVVLHADVLLPLTNWWYPSTHKHLRPCDRRRPTTHSSSPCVFTHVSLYHCVEAHVPTEVSHHVKRICRAPRRKS
jgi:hypothetical protein